MSRSKCLKILQNRSKKSPFLFLSPSSLRSFQAHECNQTSLSPSFLRSLSLPLAGRHPAPTFSPHRRLSGKFMFSIGTNYFQHSREEKRAESRGTIFYHFFLLLHSCTNMESFPSWICFSRLPGLSPPLSLLECKLSPSQLRHLIVRDQKCR